MSNVNIVSPKLAGRVTITFTIDKSGTPTSAQVVTTTLANKTVGECMAKVFASLSFPEPEGGVVKVTYPVDLSREE